MHEHTTKEKWNEWEFTSVHSMSERMTMHYILSTGRVCVDVQPFVLYTPNVCVLFSALLCNNLYYNLQDPLLQSKNINKLFISNHVQLIIHE